MYKEYAYARNDSAKLYQNELHYDHMKMPIFLTILPSCPQNMDGLITIPILEVPMKA